MLPFMEPKKIVTIIAARRNKPGVQINPEVEAPGSSMDPGLKEAAIDLLRGIEAKSPMDIAKALKAAFELCDSMPHEEGPHMNEEME